MSLHHRDLVLPATFGLATTSNGRWMCAASRSLIFLWLRIEGEPRYIAVFSRAGAVEHLHLGEFVGAMVRALEEFYGRRARYVANFLAGMGSREQPYRRRRIRRLYTQKLFLRPRTGW